MLLTAKSLTGASAMRPVKGASRLRIALRVSLRPLTIAVLIALAIAASIAPRTSCSAQVGDAIENHAEHLGSGAVHQVDRVAGLLTGGFILAGDEDTVVGIIAD